MLFMGAIASPLWRKVVKKKKVALTDLAVLKQSEIQGKTTSLRAAEEQIDKLLSGLEPFQQQLLAHKVSMRYGYGK